MFKLSDEALAAVMMALQRSLLEQSDIVPVLKSFDFELDTNECLMVRNPPNFKLPQADEFCFEEERNKTTGSD